MTGFKDDILTFGFELKDEGRGGDAIKKRWGRATPPGTRPATIQGWRKGRGRKLHTVCRRHLGDSKRRVVARAGGETIKDAGAAVQPDEDQPAKSQRGQNGVNIDWEHGSKKTVIRRRGKKDTHVSRRDDKTNQ